MNNFANNQKFGKNAVDLGLITNDEYNVLGGYDAQQKFIAGTYRFTIIFT